MMLTFQLNVERNTVCRLLQYIDKNKNTFLANRLIIFRAEYVFLIFFFAVFKTLILQFLK